MNLLNCAVIKMMLMNNSGYKKIKYGKKDDKMEDYIKEIAAIREKENLILKEITSLKKMEENFYENFLKEYGLDGDIIFKICIWKKNQKQKKWIWKKGKIKTVKYRDCICHLRCINFCWFSFFPYTEDGNVRNYPMGPEHIHIVDILKFINKGRIAKLNNNDKFGQENLTLKELYRAFANIIEKDYLIQVKREKICQEIEQLNKYEKEICETFLSSQRLNESVDAFVRRVIHRNYGIWVRGGKIITDEGKTFIVFGEDGQTCIKCRSRPTFTFMEDLQKPDAYVLSNITIEELIEAIKNREIRPMRIQKQ